MKRTVVDPISIEIDGEQYGLLLDLAAMKDFEAVTCQGVLQFIAPVFESIRESSRAALDVDSLLDGGFSMIAGLVERNAFRASDIIALLWSCLGGLSSRVAEESAEALGVIDHWRSPVFETRWPAEAADVRACSLKAVGRLISIQNVVPVSMALFAAIKEALPKPDPKAGDSNPEN